MADFGLFRRPDVLESSLESDCGASQCLWRERRSLRVEMQIHVGVLELDELFMAPHILEELEQRATKRVVDLFCFFWVLANIY